MNSSLSSISQHSKLLVPLDPSPIPYQKSALLSALLGCETELVANLQGWVAVSGAAFCSRRHEAVKFPKPGRHVGPETQQRDVEWPTELGCGLVLSGNHGPRKS